MEGAPATIANSGNGNVAVSSQSDQLPPQPNQNGGGGGGGGGSIGGGFTEDVERNSGGNRWPKQETLALIRIRSEMDAAFRDSNLKAPLWDEVSRNLSDLGFHRSAKKCREKFENVFKYHRRTKDGRSSKSHKIYRFSDQLQALEFNPRGPFPPPPPPVVMSMSNNATIDSNNASPISIAAPAVVLTMPPPPMLNHKRTFPFSGPNEPGQFDKFGETYSVRHLQRVETLMTGSEACKMKSNDLTTYPVSSQLLLDRVSGNQTAVNSGSWSDHTDTSAGEPPRKKRKWEGLFEKMMRKLMEMQEELQVKFIESLDRRERDRAAKEEAWRAHEIAKMDVERDRLAKERAIIAAKDAAILTFLQKMIGKNMDAGLVTGDRREKPPVVPQQRLRQTPPPPVQIQQPPPSPPPVNKQEKMLYRSPSSRWPKAEISALIKLRTELDTKYQQNLPKGPLWNEISAGMRNLGYNRNPTRCKEKWENINKYYKKIKEGNRKRSEYSKTCPYFDELDAIYEQKTTPIVAQPERQWPPVVKLEQLSGTIDGVYRVEQGNEDSDEYEEGGEDEGGVYEIDANKVSSVAGV